MTSSARPPTDGDWTRWSQDAAEQIQQRAEALMAEHGLGAGASYRWDLTRGRITFETGDGGPDSEVSFDVEVVGTRMRDVFVWGWANPSLPAAATTRIDAVRQFGAAHDLRLLTEPEVPAQPAEALEMLAIAARVLDADGVWIESAGSLTDAQGVDHEEDLYFLLFA